MPGHHRPGVERQMNWRLGCGLSYPDFHSHPGCEYFGAAGLQTFARWLARVGHSFSGCVRLTSPGECGDVTWLCIGSCHPGDALSFVRGARGKLSTALYYLCYLCH